MEKSIDYYSYASVIHTVVHEGLTAFRPKNSRGVLSVRHHFMAQDAAHGHRKGVQFVVRQKDDFKRPQGVRGFIVTSQEALLSEVNTFTHWTPNVYRWGTYQDAKRRYIQGHTEKNLQQINTYVIDVDTKQVSIPQLVEASMKVIEQAPTFILQTTHGFQLYFVLEEPVFISCANDFKSLRVAKRIATNLKQAFSKELPHVDLGCNDFGFFHAPSTTNIVFQEVTSQVVYADFMAWSKRYEERQGRPKLHVVSSDTSSFRATHQAWFKRLIQLTNIQGRKGQYGRNNAVFTLALACYSAGEAYEDAYNLLDEFNTNLETPVSLREMTRALHSAYSGRYQGAHLNYIQGLLDAYETDANRSEAMVVLFSSPRSRVFWKHKKSRDVRTYSHVHEWEADVEAYLEENVTEEEPFIRCSQRELAQRMGMPLSSLKKVMQQSTRLRCDVEGQGRGACTRFTTQAIHTAHCVRQALQKKRNQREQYHTYQEVQNPLLGFHRLIASEQEGVLSSQTLSMLIGKGEAKQPRYG